MAETPQQRQQETAAEFWQRQVNEGRIQRETAERLQTERAQIEGAKVEQIHKPPRPIQ